MRRISYRTGPCRSARSRPTSRCSYVESNFRVDTPVIPEVMIEARPRSREISINDAPMMLLPKARVRDSLAYYEKFRRPYTVVAADAPYQGLHISTVQSVDTMTPRVMPKSALKQRKDSFSRSETDSGFCSLKRSVTFDNLNQSQSTVFQSEFDFDNLSDCSDDVKNNLELDHDLSCHCSRDLGDLPDYLDAYGDNEPVLPYPPRSAPPRPSSRASKRRRHGDGAHDADMCEICGVVLTTEERVRRSFGKVDGFLDWVMSRWGKVSQYTPNRILTCLY